MTKVMILVFLWSISPRSSRNTNPKHICICYLDVNWLIPKIPTCRARIWSLLASERSERDTNFIFCRAGWYVSVSIIFTFRWHIHHPYINHKHGYIYICIFAGKITWFKIFKIPFPKTVVHKSFANIPLIFTGLYKC